MAELEDLDCPPKEYKLTRTGKVILTLSGGAFATLVAVTTPFVLPALRRVCLPYVPATTRQVNNVMNLLANRKGSVIDLGSGDGRIVIEAAKQGFHAQGVELNPWLVWYARWQAWRAGVRNHTLFQRKDLWKADLTKHENIVIFGVEQMMEQLEGKLDRELTTDGQVVACRFALPTWTPVRTVDSGIDTVWLYKRPKCH